MLLKSKCYNVFIIFSFRLIWFFISLVFPLYKLYYTKKKNFFFTQVEILIQWQTGAFSKGLGKSVYMVPLSASFFCVLFIKQTLALSGCNDVFKGRISDMLSLRKKPFLQYIGFFYYFFFFFLSCIIMLKQGLQPSAF